MFIGEMVSVDGNVARIASAVALDSAVRPGDIRLTLKLSDFDDVMKDGTIAGASAMDALASFASVAQVQTDGPPVRENVMDVLASPVANVRNNTISFSPTVDSRIVPVPNVKSVDLSRDEKTGVEKDEITYWGKDGEAFKSTDYKFKLDFIANNGAVYNSLILVAAEFKRNKAFNKPNFKV